MGGLRVIVAGGGPAGLTAALAARARGAEVVVLEKRVAYSRPQLVGMTAGSIRAMQDLQVPTGQFTPLDQFTATVGEARAVTMSLASGAWLMQIPFFPTTSAAIRNVEACLRAAASLAGVRVIAGAEALCADFLPDAVGVRYRHDDSEATIRGDYLVVADGAHSAVCRTLGLPARPIPNTAEHIVLGGISQAGSSSHLYVGTHVQPRRVFRIGCSERTCVGASVPDAHAAAMAGAPVREAYLRREVFPRVGLDPAVPIDFSLCFCRQSHIRPNTTVGDRVVVIGDAARSVTPWTGIGVNAAIHDGIRFGALCARLTQARFAGSRAHAVAQFGRGTVATSLAMIGYEQLIGAHPRHVLSLALEQPVVGGVASTLLRGALEAIARTLS